jgi:restriction endonuclease
MTASPALGNFAAASDQLHRQEFARLAATVTPRIEAFRSMTRDGLRDELASMMDRLGHELITISPWLMTIKDGRKYVTDCAKPTDLAPTKAPTIRRLHDAVIGANAARGIYVTPRSFTPDAEHYASRAPIDLVDGPLLIKSMQRSRRGVLLPRTYKAMCRQCGEIVQHRLDKEQVLPCGSGHLVAPTISHAALIPFRPPTPAQQPAAINPTLAFAVHPAGPHPGGSGPVIRPRNMSAKAQRRRAIKAHNNQMRGRAIKQQQQHTDQ